MDAREAAGVAREDPEDLAGVDVPQFDERVARGGDEGRVVQLDRVDRAAVAGQNPDERAVGAGPDPDRRVLREREECVSTNSAGKIEQCE